MREEVDTIKCHCCGKEIKKVDERNYPDYLKVQKDWGYFSDKDLTRHSFIICEVCYDRWISSFIIPINETQTIEIFSFTDEEDYDR